MDSVILLKPTNWSSQARSKLVAIICSILISLCFVSSIDAAEQILAFDSKITVRGDGILDVTETIRVRAEGNQIKRGIFRDFPLTFHDEAGKRHRVEFRLRSVSRDGQPEPYHTASSGNGIRIYIGEEDVFLRPDIYIYDIRYETSRQIQFLPDQTELFWNVTGNDWAFPILSATALVTLPDNRAPERWTAYTGELGETGEDFTGRVLGNNALAVATSRILKPDEGLSVVVEIPPGLVAPPSGTTVLYHWYLDNLRFILGGFGFLGVFAFYVGAWRAVGRDPPKGTIIPLFHPPDAISPALAGYIRNWGWRGTWRDFTAAAISLAVKGYLIFDDSTGTIVLTRAQNSGGPPTTDLPPGERAIFDWVSSHNGLVTIDKPYGKSIGKALKSFKSKIEGENQHRFFKQNIGYFVIGIVMTVVALVLVLAFGELSENQIVLLIFIGFFGTFAGTLIARFIRATFGDHSVRTFVFSIIIFVAVKVLSGIFVTTFGTYFWSFSEDFSTALFTIFLEAGFPFVLVGGFATMNGVFFYLLRAPTAAGRIVMDEIEGLELYIRTAETARFNAVGAPDFTTDHFEQLLPYAIALDAEEPWSDAFADAFARAHIGETAETSYRPLWHGGRGWSEDGFARSISSSVSAAQGYFSSAVPARSSSSGFSGGGGSGGGGGGGGGGGW